MPKTEGMNKYVVFEEMPQAGQYAADEAFKAKWAQLIAVRDEVKKVLEQARAEKVIGASLELPSPCTAMILCTACSTASPWTSWPT